MPLPPPDLRAAAYNGLKLYPLSDHPLRHLLNNELHARPPVALSPPERVSHLAIHSGDQAAGEDHAALVRLCERYGVTPPHAGITHFSGEFVPFRLKWERHTEFVTYTFFIAGDFADPFGTPVIDQVARDWLAQLPGQVLVAAHVAVLPREAPAPTIEQLAAWFSPDSLMGSLVAGGAAAAYTDHRIQADGFSRILIHDRELGKRQAGRLVQRLLEAETYRMMALLAFPMAAEIAPEIARCEREFAELTASMAESFGPQHERQLLDRLIQLAATIERLAASSSYRFRASRAYHALVERRIQEMREERISGLPTLAESMERRFLPAMRTCISVAERLKSLSERVSRASGLLRTRVDITIEEQNRDLLQSVDRRARLQLLLNETVEGLSVVVISYYALSLVHYVLTGIEHAHTGIDPELVTGVAAPVILVVVWWLLRRIRKRLRLE
ncbi:MAG: DUF3422 domain-containing protein [Acetobacteraceae bacterium]|nr:DUF3422 domain-containing protein [Acetobacteraceae bacterium]